MPGRDAQNVHNISHADDLLARFRSDDTLACSDKQHLITAVDVHFVPGTPVRIASEFTKAARLTYVTTFA